MSLALESDALSEDPFARAEPALTIEILFERHGNQVFGIVASLLGPGASRADAQDVTQQVFMAAHKALPSFRGESAPLTWLYKIASRMVIEHLRTWRRQRRLAAALEAEPVSRTNLEDVVSQREQLRHLWRALMKIKPKKRIVYVMYEIEGFSGKQIAEVLDLPEATVRVRLLHARRELVTHLKRALEGKRP